MKLLSIITVHLNDFSGLRATNASLGAVARAPEFEWVVVDGASTPNSMTDRKILKEASTSAQQFVSEADSGIYDAMNKGVGLATGKYLLFLNAGDKLSPSFSIPTIFEILAKESPDMIWAKASREYPDGIYGLLGYRSPRWAWIGQPVCHQSVLFARSLFENMKYDTSLRIAGDYDLILRAMKSGASIYYLDQVISEFVAGGISEKEAALSRRERDKVRLRYYRIPKYLNQFLSLADRGIEWLNLRSPFLYRAWRKRF